MVDLNSDILNLKKKYRQIFVSSVEEIKKRIDEIKPDIDGDIFDKFELDSDGEHWQKQVLKMFEEDIAKDIVRKWADILRYREKFSCKGCAVCCNLACSEFSTIELVEKAKNGDNFANQFLSVFIPYKSKEDAEKIYPEYIKMLKENKEEDVYFYHCPRLNECNRCSDYKNRPRICRDFPDNPLSILPATCGFYEWKQEVEPVALMLHSMLEIIEYYENNIPVKKD